MIYSPAFIVVVASLLSQSLGLPQQAFVPPPPAGNPVTVEQTEVQATLQTQQSTQNNPSPVLAQTRQDQTQNDVVVSNNTQLNEPSSSNNNLAIILGTTLGAVGAVGLTTAAVLTAKHRSKKEQKASYQAAADYSSNDPDYVPYTPQNGDAPAPQETVTGTATKKKKVEEQRLNNDEAGPSQSRENDGGLDFDQLDKFASETIKSLQQLMATADENQRNEIIKDIHGINGIVNFIGKDKSFDEKVIIKGFKHVVHVREKFNI